MDAISVVFQYGDYNHSDINTIQYNTIQYKDLWFGAAHSVLKISWSLSLQISTSLFIAVSKTAWPRPHTESVTPSPHLHTLNF